MNDMTAATESAIMWFSVFTDRWCVAVVESQSAVSVIWKVVVAATGW